MKITFSIFILITAGVSFFASVGQFLLKERRLETNILGFLFFCLAALQTQCVLMITGIIFEYPILFFPHVTFLYIIGVLVYFSFFLVTVGPGSLPEKKFLFFLPSCFAFVFDLYYLIIPETNKTLILQNLFSGTAFEYGPFLKIIMAGAGIQASLYWTILLVNIIKMHNAGKMIILYRFTTFNILMSIIAIDILIIGYIFSLSNFYIISSIMLGLLITAGFFIRDRYPEIRKIIVPENKKRYSRSNLASIKTDELYQRIMDLVDIEKVYSDENISLADFADKLSITPHQLSEFLNERLNCNFNTFINQHRIKEAVRLLEEEPERTILSIANEVGFNSKSSFYDFFSRFMGMTPTRYRTKISKKKPQRM